VHPTKITQLKSLSAKCREAFWFFADGKT